MDNMSFDTHPVCVHLYCSPQLVGLGVCPSHALNETEGKKSQACESDRHCGMPHLGSLDTAHVPKSAKMKLQIKAAL